MWVANSINDSVSHIDPETGAVVAVIGVGDQPVDLVLDEQGLLVANAASGNVTPIDPDSDKAALSVDVGNGPHESQPGWLYWVSDLLDGTVHSDRSGEESRLSDDRYRRRPERACRGSRLRRRVRCIHRLRFHDRSGLVLRDEDPARISGWWPRPRRSHRVGGGSRTRGRAPGWHLRVVAPSGVLGSIDPAVAYNGLSWSILALGYDGLVGFRRVGGLGGGTLVPDLALSIPAPTEGGRTYTFQLREGIRDSMG